MAYAVASDLYFRFGRTNVRKWADVDNDEDDDSIDDRIAWAIGEAEDEVNDRLRHGPYTVPFVSDSSNTIPGKITSMTALYAGVLLYDARRVVDDDESVDDVKGARKQFERTMDKIMGGKYHLDYSFASLPYPQAITNRELADRRAALGISDSAQCNDGTELDDAWRPSC